MTNDLPLLCTKCLKTLELGRGEFYVVAIEAIADFRRPPTFDGSDFGSRPTAPTGAKLSRPSKTPSPRKHSTRVLSPRRDPPLQRLPYRDWIENPAD